MAVVGKKLCSPLFQALCHEDKALSIRYAFWRDKLLTTLSDLVGLGFVLHTSSKHWYGQKF